MLRLLGPGPGSPARGVVGEDTVVDEVSVVTGLPSKKFNGFIEMVSPLRSLREGKSGIVARVMVGGE